MTTITLAKRFQSFLNPTVEEPDNSELITAITLQNDQVNTLLAGQAAELAQLRQAMLVVAKVTDSLHNSMAPIHSDLAVIIQQTKTKIRPWADIRKEMEKMYREILDDNTFINTDVQLVKTGRVLRSILSFGTAAPEAVFAARQQVHTHMKTVRQRRDKLESLSDYAIQHHQSDYTAWISNMTTKLTAGKKSWSFQELFTLDFIPQYHQQLNDMRNL
jgi:uncharacterized protein (DUF885 family)